MYANTVTTHTIGPQQILLRSIGLPKCQEIGPTTFLLLRPPNPPLMTAGVLRRPDLLYILLRLSFSCFAIACSVIARRFILSSVPFTHWNDFDVHRSCLSITSVLTISDRLFSLQPVLIRHILVLWAVRDAQVCHLGAVRMSFGHSLSALHAGQSVPNPPSLHIRLGLRLRHREFPPHRQRRSSSLARLSDKSRTSASHMHLHRAVMLRSSWHDSSFCIDW